MRERKWVVELRNKKKKKGKKKIIDVGDFVVGNLFIYELLLGFFV